MSLARAGTWMYCLIRGKCTNQTTAWAENISSPSMKLMQFFSSLCLLCFVGERRLSMSPGILWLVGVLRLQGVARFLSLVLTPSWRLFHFILMGEKTATCMKLKVESDSILLVGLPEHPTINLLMYLFICF